MGKHKNPPIRNKVKMVPVNVNEVEKAAAKTAEQAKDFVYEALRQQFGFGPSRMEKLKATVAEMERLKSIDAWVDYSIAQKLQQVR